MSYMNHNESFALAGGIREMSFDETEQVDGGFLQFVVIAAFRCAASTACRVGVLAAAGAVATAVGYENNRV